MKKVLPLLLLCVFISCKKEEQISNKLPFDDATENLPINKLQYIGSHNSYRRLTDNAILGLVKNISGILPDDLDPKQWEYDHKPLPYQLDLGLRNFELDLYYDPIGGRYANRLGNTLVGKPTATNNPKLQAPGMKVLHIPDFDYNTNYLTFVDAITTLRDWSQANRDHLPIFVLVEQKDFTVGDVIPLFTTALPFDKTALDAIDAEIESVFAGYDNLYSPDDLRKSYPNLKAAITAEGWPAVRAMRGKILFITYKNSAYLTGAPNLEGRTMFQFSDAGSANAAFVILDNPSNTAEIQAALNAGSIIRSRTDGGTDEARTGDYTNMNKAFASGAQLLSTDYYEPSYNVGKRGWTDYQVSFENRHFARVNIVNAPEFTGKLVRE